LESIPPREITLKQALEEIQGRTGYIVIVNYDNIPASKMVSMPTENLNAEELAEQVLSGTGYTCDVIGKRLLIVPEPPKVDDGQGAISAIWRVTRENESVEMETITFRAGSTAVEAGFMDNANALGKINRSLTDSATIARLDHISVTAASSPDGTTAGNERLALQRALTTKGYLEKRYPHIAPEKVQAFSAGEEWSGLQKLIAEDGNVPEGAEVLALLDTISPEANIRDSIKVIADGRTWRYIAANLLPNLRGAAAITLHFADPSAQQRNDTLRVNAPTGVTMAGSGVQRVEFQEPEPPAPVVEPIPEPEPEPVLPKPLFAIKTNALMDVASVINIELEVPIGDRWSVAGEVMFPWWMTVNGTLEARRWFGDRSSRSLLTGWFAGAYFGGGTYDIKRHSGDFLHAGFSGGYAHPLNQSGNMRMEYSLGVGYLWGTDRTLPGTSEPLKWFGPTRAKVSLVWMLNRKPSEK
jgi:outer membrane protein OmpA-like peptidoglycan-associated protein